MSAVIAFKTIQPKLAFRKYNKGDGFIPKLISWWCNGPYYHVEFILEDKWISANPDDNIYIRKLRPLDHVKYDYIDLPSITVTEDTYNHIWGYIKDLTHTKYDMLGLIWNQVFGFNIYNDRYFCSELIVDILKLLGYHEFYDYRASEFSPQDLYDIVTKHFTGPNAKQKYQLRRYSLMYKVRKIFKFLQPVLTILSLRKWYGWIKVLINKLKKRK